MVEDIERGKVNCVLCKDLSRFGRNYVEIGKFLDEFVPEHGIRFTALHDNYDSDDGHDDISVPIKNVINEMYPRIISREVRKVKQANAEEGKYMGSHAPYGFRKKPDNKYVLEPEEPVAGIIRRIYLSIVNEMKSAMQIAEELTLEQIDSPLFYRYAKEGKLPPRKTPNDNRWSSMTINQLIRNVANKGDLAQGKRHNVSYKNKYRQQVPEEYWIYSEGTHEGIVSKDEWARANEIVGVRKKERSKIRLESLPD